jgi:hypothetical protein
MTQVLLLDGRAPTVNQVYGKLHRYTRSLLVQQWRNKAAEGASAWPSYRQVRIEALCHQQDRRWTADVGACMPAVKACVDGFVDAGVLADDGPDIVTELRFLAPVVDGWDGLEVRLIEV